MIFSVIQEMRKGDFFLVLSLVDPEGFSEKAIRGYLPSGLAPTFPVAVPERFSLQVLQRLVADKKVVFKGRSLFFNPFSQVRLTLEIDRMESETLELKGFLLMDGDVIPLSSMDMLFSSWGVYKQKLAIFPKDADGEWIKKLAEDPCIVSGREKRELEECPPDGFSEIVWKGGAKESPCMALPILMLRDRHGAFADLYLEYGAGEVEPYGAGNRSDGKHWEQDLLQTDFVRKEQLGSAYYCPMDKIGKSISFLLDLGWKIRDHLGREVKKITEVDCRTDLMGNGILVKGKCCYGEYKVDLQDVVGVFSRRERFLDLSPSAVAWIDESVEEYSALMDLVDAELVTEGCLVHKRAYGTLQKVQEQFGGDFLDRLQSGKPATFVLSSGFSGKLYPYQEEGRQWLHFLQQNGFSGLLADEMGLGKTVQVLSFISACVVDKPILLVVPTSLVFNWKREWEVFLKDKKLFLYQGKKDKEEMDRMQPEVILTSYPYLRMDDTLSREHFSVVILDEAQLIKNPDSQIAKAACSLRADMKLCLTGTPIENRAEDLWSLFHFLEPELLGDRKAFLHKLSLDSKKVRKLIQPFILRRDKEMVGLQLPEKMEQEIFIEMSEDQRSLYEEYLRKAKSGILQKVQRDGVSAHRMEVLEVILRLRQICCHPFLVGIEGVESAKLTWLLQDLEEIVSSGRSVLVYSQFTQMLRIIEREIRARGWGYSYLDGETKDREDAVRKFQEDAGVPIFLISLKAGGVGLNLTKADYVLLYDPWWNEAVERQAIDRVHRLGVKHTVIAKRYIASLSVEEKMMKLKTGKNALAKGVLDFGQQEPVALLEELIRVLQE